VTTRGKTCEAVRAGKKLFNKMLDKSNFSIEVAVANCGGAMEADTISRNGRSPKSLMSRKNVLKYTKIGIKQWFLLILIFACLSITKISAQNADVYVAGTVNGKAIVWRNGIVNELQCVVSRYYYIIKNAIYVNGNDVYVIGYSIPQSGYISYRYTLWKNGIATDFPSDTYPKSVCVSGNDVYMAGGMDIGARYDVAVVWKNGEATYLTDGTGDANAICVSVIGNDVYVLGNDRYFDGINNNEKYIKVWKNNVLIYTIKTSDVLPASMYIDGSDVYVIGATGGNASVWKNGIETVFGKGGMGISYYTTSISGNKSNVYVAGYRNSGGVNDGALLWTNGNVQLTPDAYFYSVFVYNNDVYVAGTAKIASIWQPIIYKNGVITPLSNEAGDAEAVFVSSSSTAINKIDNTHLNIYPNPINNSFIVDYDNFAQVKICDMLGKEALTQNVNGKTEIDISHLSKGIYIISITSEGKIIGNYKIMKQ